MKLTDEKWESLTNDLSKAFKLDPKQTKWLKESAITRLIGVIPYEADCKNPDRAASFHLGTYLLSIQPSTKKYSLAVEEDSKQIYSRLFHLSQFEEGNKAIIKKGMALIALSMIHDYKRDITKDKKIGKFNPLSKSALPFDNWEKELIKDTENIISPQIDQITTIDTVSAVWWMA